MIINGKVHLFFEQSGVFKNEFIKLGIPAYDYDIQNNFGQTDHVIDLFAEIEKAYMGGGNQYLIILQRMIWLWLSFLVFIFLQLVRCL